MVIEYNNLYKFRMCYNFMDAYNIAKELSSYRTNVQRGDFAKDLAQRQAKFLGYEFVTQNIDVDSKYGDMNFILRSNKRSPLLITAHYDAFVIDESSGLTVPGANDNGSGLGVILQASKELKKLPVDFALFGAEEVGCIGAKHYISEMKDKPRAVINLDTCGSGGKLGILIPKSVYVGNTIEPISTELNSHYLATANKLGYQVCEDDPLATGDHCAFMEEGIPATTLQGEDHSFYGIVDGQYVEPMMVMHTEKDTIKTVDKQFLEQIVQVLTEGSKRLISQ